VQVFGPRQPLLVRKKKKTGWQGADLSKNEPHRGGEMFGSTPEKGLGGGPMIASKGGVAKPLKKMVKGGTFLGRGESRQSRTLGKYDPKTMQNVNSKKKDR